MSTEWNALVVEAGDGGKRIDVFLSERGRTHSRSLAARLAEDGRVHVNGDPVRKSYIVSEGDRISLMLAPDPSSVLAAERIPLDIRYEDSHLIVLSKQAGLVVHPAEGNWTGTLVNALLAHCGAALGTMQGEDRPGIVHRLDKDTTGLMLVGKTDEAQAALSDAIRIRAVERRYLALVHGYVAPDAGIIDAPIARDERARMRMAVSDLPKARLAVTNFRVLERFSAGRHDDGHTLIECALHTGRTHQIRVHMAYARHPVVGDQLYGKRAIKADKGLTRQFLHAYRLAFEHPVTGEHLTFIDPLPADLSVVLGELEPDSLGRTIYGDLMFEVIATRS